MKRSMVHFFRQSKSISSPLEYIDEKIHEKSIIYSFIFIFMNNNGYIESKKNQNVDEVICKL